jgi:autotransporter-associated beta strand protein
VTRPDRSRRNAVKSICRLKPLSACLALATLVGPAALDAQTLFWNTNNATATWTNANWAASSGGPFTTAWTTNSNARFTANSTVTFASTSIGNVTVDNGVTVTVTAAGTLSSANSVRTIDVGTGALLTWTSQTISNNSTTGFIKNGAGTWNIGAMTAATGFTGGFTLNAGTVVVSGDKSFGTGALTINGGTIQSSGARAFTPTSLTIGGDFALTGSGTPSWSGSVAVGSAIRTITNNNTGSGATFSGVISGSTGGGLAFSGTGTTTLSGANTFSGGTTVSAGTLNIAHHTALGTGSAAVNGGNLSVGAGVTVGNNIALGSSGSLTGASTALFTGRISGSGSLMGTITIASGGSIAPGNSPGNLTVIGSLTFSSGSSYSWELGSLTTSGAGTNFDLITLSGGASLTTNSVSLSPSFGPSQAPNQGNLFWNSAQSWLIVAGNASSTITGTFMVNNASWSSLGSFSTSQSGNDLLLTWTPSAIPEPSTYAAIAGAAALAAASWHRRRKPPIEQPTQPS